MATLMRRAVWIAAIGAGFLLATAIETAAETKIVGPESLKHLGQRPYWSKAPRGVDLFCYPNGWRPPDDRWIVANMTSYTIKAGTILYFKTCDKSGCRTWTYVVPEDWPPNTALTIWNGPASGVPPDAPAFQTPPGVTCSPSLLPPLRERKTNIPEYSRTRPPGPPQPGLLDDSPGVSRQSPSGVGTPKPSAPPAYSPYGTKTLR
jgi:hypothetical protein